MTELTEKNNMDSSLAPAMVKAVPGFIKMLYTDAAQPGVQVIGKNLAKAFDFCCLPFHVMGYMSESVKLNLGQKLKDYAEKLATVPKDKQCEVDPQIGAPIIDHLSYTTNEEIADLFTTLLANASNLDTLDKAHPSFAQIIGRLSVDEARIIKFLKGRADIPFCAFRAIIKDDLEFISIDGHATLIPYEVEMAFPGNTQAYLSNLTSLGILVDREGMYRTDDTDYKKICDRYDLETLKEKYRQKGYKDVTFEPSFYEVTPFGRLFIDACIRN